jgi:hypothetical protein
MDLGGFHEVILVCHTVCVRQACADVNAVLHGEKTRIPGLKA